MGTKCERGRGRGIISFVSTRVSNQIYIVENESRNGFSPIIKHIQENTSIRVKLAATVIQGFPLR